MNKSFLKWVGGKTKLLSQIEKYLPEGNRLVEPFCGSCVVSLNSEYKNYLANDINSDLINLFNIIKNEDTFNFVKQSKKYFIDGNDLEKYNSLRSMFNNTKDLKLRAFLFIYLNRHCFNGMCRYNSSGGYNIPFGKYNTIYYPEKEIFLFSKLSQSITFSNKNFLNLKLKQGDIVYCDPPYIPINETSSFTNYTGKDFSLEEHKQLANWCEVNNKELKIPFLISNNDTKLTREIYKKADDIIEVEVSRSMGSKKGTKEKKKEVLIIYKG